MRLNSAPSMLRGMLLAGFVVTAMSVSVRAQEHNHSDAEEAMAGSLMELQPEGDAEAMPGTHSIF